MPRQTRFKFYNPDFVNLGRGPIITNNDWIADEDELAEMMYRQSRQNNINRLINEKETKMGKMNKFYVAAPHIANAILNGTNADWTHATADEAIKHANQIIDREGKEICVIVEVKYIVRKKKPVVNTVVTKVK